MQNNYPMQRPVLAGFFPRLAAYLIDMLIVGIALLFVRLFIGGFSALLGGGEFRNFLFHYSFLDVFLYLCHVFYFIIFTYFTGTTIGKKAMQLRVISAKESKLSFMMVAYRETVGRFLAGLILNLGYLMVFVDTEKRGVHDWLCDTRVVYAERVQVVVPNAPIQPPMSPGRPVQMTQSVPQQVPGQMPQQVPPVQQMPPNEPKDQFTSK